jgi:ribose transport system permease protein
MLNLKKDLGLFVLILVVGTVVALINPRFLSAINISNTANLVGLFGLFAIREAFVIITGHRAVGRLHDRTSGRDSLT